jgi:nucleoside phosphorylase
MSGVTAGVSDAVNIGDVLIAESTWDYGSGKYDVESGAKTFKPDPRPISLEGFLVERFQALASRDDVLGNIRQGWIGTKPETVLSVRVGPLPSGAAVVADPSILKELQKRSRKIIGLDMEGFGVYYAANHSSNPRPLPVLIKGVSDFADTEKQNQEKFRAYAAYVSAAIVDYALLNILQFDH